MWHFNLIRQKVFRFFRLVCFGQSKQISVICIKWHLISYFLIVYVSPIWKTKLYLAISFNECRYLKMRFSFGLEKNQNKTPWITANVKFCQNLRISNLGEANGSGKAVINLTMLYTGNNTRILILHTIPYVLLP